MRCGDAAALFVRCVPWIVWFRRMDRLPELIPAVRPCCHVSQSWFYTIARWFPNSWSMRTCYDHDFTSPHSQITLAAPTPHGGAPAFYFRFLFYHSIFHVSSGWSYFLFWKLVFEKFISSFLLSNFFFFQYFNNERFLFILNFCFQIMFLFFQKKLSQILFPNFSTQIFYVFWICALMFWPEIFIYFLFWI